MNIESIDHIVLTVKNIEIICAFYTRVLGMKRNGVRRIACCDPIHDTTSGNTDCRVQN